MQTIPFLATPSAVFGTVTPSLGGTIYVHGPSDFLGASFELQLSDDGGVTYLPLQTPITKPCVIAVPPAKIGRFVCTAGPAGALGSIVALCHLPSND